MLIELKFSSIYWTHCVLHTLNIALKNSCATKKYYKKYLYLSTMFLNLLNY